MKNKLQWSLGLVFLSLFWNACTVQKCVYSKGFSVDFKGLNGTKKSNEPAAKQAQFIGEIENEAAVEENEAMEVHSLQAATQLITQNQVNSFDTAKKGMAVIKSVTNLGEAKGRNASRANKSMAQTNVLSRAGAAPLAPDWLILLICIFIPPIAVAIMSNGNIQKILIALLLWILGVLPGVVYAFLVFLHYL